MMRRGLLAAGLLVAVSACAGRHVTLPLGIGQIGAQPGDNVPGAIAKLESGEWNAAQRDLREVLKQRPRDPLATKMLRQIEIDPKILLGRTSYAYRARPGDSFQSLAERFLGDRMMFYALARYNGLSDPRRIAAGGRLRIPGSQRTAEPPPLQPAVSRPGPPRKSKPAVQSMPALARALREQGLRALAQGNPDRAVAMLKRAMAADPADATIASDLARATRVRDALHGGR